MVMLIPWRMSILCTLATGACLFFSGRLLLYDLRAVAGRQAAPAVWLFVLFGVVAIASPAPHLQRVAVMVMFLFMYRISTVDAATGFIDRWLNLSFLLCGLLASGVLKDGHGVSAFFMAVACLNVHLLINLDKERLGVGDLLLLVGLSAWLGFAPALLVALCGCGAWLLWHNTLTYSRRVEGALGPWLCAAAAVHQLQNLYQPVWTFP